MDIPRIGSGVSYRPPQAWAGRTAESAVDESGRPEIKPDLKADAKAAAKTDPKPTGSGRVPGEPLSDEQQKQVNKLKAIDTKVRQHEAAHQSAGGGLAGGASFTYQEGPDGKRYAVGGEVPIKMGGSSSPEASIRQLDQVKRAALAPADPSGQDLAVAAQATASQAEAQQQLNTSRAAEAAGQGGTGTGTGTPVGGSSPDSQPPASPWPSSPSSDGHPEHAAGGRNPGTETAAAQDAIAQTTAATRALAARGVAAYGAAASVTAAPYHAAVHFA